MTIRLYGIWLLLLVVFTSPNHAQEFMPSMLLSQRLQHRSADLKPSQNALGARPSIDIPFLRSNMLNKKHLQLKLSNSLKIRNKNNMAPGNVPPQMNAANKLFRFALELGALGAMGWWGYEQGDGASKYALMSGIPIATAITWGVFTVPSDPSRGKEGPVSVSGITRLLLEGAVFGLTTWALHDLGKDALAVGSGSAVIFHYTLSLDRLKWLVKQ